jgi:hypothetical protein
VPTIAGFLNIAFFCKRSRAFPGVSALVVAFLLSYAAHHEWGLSGVPVRTGALLAALLIATLVAIEFFGKSLRKPK